MYSAHAWVGGPFSNNTFFGSGSEDGVYEATAAAVNGVGIFRIVVGNAYQGVNPEGVVATAPSTQAENGNAIILVPGVNSGNVFVGAFGGRSFVFFYEGVSYIGTTLGSVSGVNGSVFAVGGGNDNNGAGTNSLGASFTARIQRSGNFIPATAFNGSGTGRINGAAATEFSFTVFGSKVSNNIFFGL